MIATTEIQTPIGSMLAGAVKEQICLLEYVDSRMIEKQLDRLKKFFNTDTIPGSNPILETLEQQLKEYFNCKRQKFTLPLATSGTAFQKRIWESLLAIPYGQTISYKEQAMSIGQSRAYRAVARTNGLNRIAIIIPCHRVIGANGKLVGYGGGMDRKKFLLDLESDHH